MFKSICINSKLMRFLSMATVCLFVFSIIQFSNYSVALADTSGDAYITYDSGTGTWSLGTDRVEQKLQFSGGKFLLKSLYNKETSREYVENGIVSEEFRITADSTEYTGNSGGYTYDSYAISMLPAPSASLGANRALQLKVSFHNSIFDVEAYYVVYPSDTVNSINKQSLIKKWFVFKNRSGSNKTFSNPYMACLKVMQSRVNNLRYAYFDGGGHHMQFIPHWIDLNSSYYRLFQSDETYDGQFWRYQGSNKYSPFYVIEDKVYNEGIFVGTDYAGVWEGKIGNFESSSVFVGTKLKDYSDTFANGASLKTPESFVGVYKKTYYNSLDNVSEQLYDWQYVYRWDYEKNTYDSAEAYTYVLGGDHQQMMFDTVNVSREIGADIVHEDDGWYDKKSSWVSAYGADYKYVAQYAKKSGMNLRMWMPVQTYEDGGAGVNENPSFPVNPPEIPFYGKLFDTSNDSAIAWMKDKVLNKRIDFDGGYSWRYDAVQIAPNSGVTKIYLKQFNNWLGLIKDVRTTDPNMKVQHCSSGGDLLCWSVVELVDDFQFTDFDGWAQYYCSFLYPYSKMTGVGGAAGNAQTMKDDPAQRDKARNQVMRSKYYYLQGATGRYSKVYHPQVTGALHEYDYIQHMNYNHTKGVIRKCDNDITDGVRVYPTGLIGTQSYTVKTLRNGTTTTDTGANLMANGILLTTGYKDEEIIFNMTGTPGLGTDTTVPTNPGSPTKKLAGYIGRSGVELNWNAATDNSGVLYYEVKVGGAVVGKVASGTFYFYQGGNIDDTYSVAGVDGDGNKSGFVTAGYVSAGDDATQPAKFFSSSQGTNNWYYQYYNGTSYNNMLWDSANSRWYGGSNYCFVGGNWMHPGESTDSVRSYTVQNAGTITIEGLAYKGDNLGDGVNLKILKNGSQIWPSSGWGLVTNTSGSWVRAQTAVAAGDTISIVVNRNSTVSNDTLYFNPSIAYDSKENKASAGWSSSQGAKNWSYQKYDGTTFTNLTWDSTNGYWRDGATYCIVGYNWQHPDNNMSARVFNCPAAGNIVIRGYISKPAATGNGINAKIMKNGVQIWPSSGWKLVNHTANVEALVETSVSANDKIQFIVNNNGDSSNDTTYWEPTISYK